MFCSLSYNNKNNNNNNKLYIKQKEKLAVNSILITLTTTERDSNQA